MNQQNTPHRPDLAATHLRAVHPDTAPVQKYPYVSILGSETQGMGKLIVPAGIKFMGRWNGAIIVTAPTSANEVPGDLIIDEGSVVEGIVIGFRVIVHGTVQGSVIAREFLEVGPSGRISEGAFYSKWRCDDGSEVSGTLGKISATTDIVKLIEDISGRHPDSESAAWARDLKL